MQSPPRPDPRPQAQPPAPKPDPVNLLQQQLERLKRIEDILNFIKSSIIIGAILYTINFLLVACNLLLGYGVP